MLILNTQFYFSDMPLYSTPQNQSLSFGFHFRTIPGSPLTNMDYLISPWISNYNPFSNVNRPAVEKSGMDR